MIEELLAVVGHEEDQGVVINPALLQLVDEPAELLIAIGDVPVVLRDQAFAVGRILLAGIHSGVSGDGLGLEHRVEGCGGRIRNVGIHGVDVEERRQTAAGIDET